MTDPEELKILYPANCLLIGEAYLCQENTSVIQHSSNLVEVTSQIQRVNGQDGR
jgi:hypothetical protein